MIVTRRKIIMPRGLTFFKTPHDAYCLPYQDEKRRISSFFLLESHTPIKMETWLIFWVKGKRVVWFKRENRMVVLAEWSSRGNWRILSSLGSIQRWAEARNSPPDSPNPWRPSHPISPWNFTVTVMLPATLLHPATPYDTDVPNDRVRSTSRRIYNIHYISKNDAYWDQRNLLERPTYLLLRHVILYRLG